MVAVGGSRNLDSNWRLCIIVDGLRSTRMSGKIVFSFLFSMLDAISELIQELLPGPEERLVVGGTLVLIVIAALVYVTLKIRSRAIDDGSGSSDHLSTFRELYEAGEISEFEYRRVKMKLGDSVRDGIDEKLGNSAINSGSALGDPALESDRPPRNLPPSGPTDEAMRPLEENDQLDSDDEQNMDDDR